MGASSRATLVFVVDDDPEVRTFLSEILEDIYLSLPDLDGYTLASRIA